MRECLKRGDGKDCGDGKCDGKSDRVLTVTGEEGGTIIMRDARRVPVVKSVECIVSRKKQQQQQQQL